MLSHERESLTPTAGTKNRNVAMSGHPSVSCSTNFALRFGVAYRSHYYQHVMDRVASLDFGRGARWLATVAALGVVAGLGYFSTSRPSLALAVAAAILGIGALSVDMVVLPLLAFPCMLVLVRVGATLSASDLVLFLASLIALTQVRTRLPHELRNLLWVAVVYQATLIPTLIRNRYPADYIEWAHELLLVGGSLLVGWTVGNSGRARLAVGMYVAPVALLAAWAAVLAPLRHFAPIDLLNFQKNALGDIFAFAAVIGYARPEWLGWRARTGNGVALLCALGALAVQSRQGMVSLVAGVAIVALRAHAPARRSRLILLGTVPLLVTAYLATASQLASGNRFDSTHQRLLWYAESVDIWRTSRLVGVGLRWWYTGRFGVSFQPPNAEYEMLSSAGLIGLAGFVATSLAALWLLWRLDPRYGTLAFAIVATRLVQGQLDLFWVASQSSFPWLIAGLSLGVQSTRHRSAAADRQVCAPTDRSARRVRTRPCPTRTPTAPSDLPRRRPATSPIAT